MSVFKVTGSSFLLWVLESYQSMVVQVQTIMSQVVLSLDSFKEVNKYLQEKNLSDEGLGQHVCKAKK